MNRRIRRNVRALAIASFVLIAGVVVGAPKSFGQELPPMGEVNVPGHQYNFVGVVDGCRVHSVRYWGKEIFIVRCPEGAAESSYETGGKNSQFIQTVPAQ